MSFEIGPTSATSLPEEVLDAIGVAADRADELAAEGRELHFSADERTGRVVVEVRDLASGTVLRSVSPAVALSLLSAAAQSPWPV
jgi:uncharacterized FlaG/YvyC family protein